MKNFVSLSHIRGVGVCLNFPVFSDLTPRACALIFEHVGQLKDDTTLSIQQRMICGPDAESAEDAELCFLVVYSSTIQQMDFCRSYVNANL